LGRTDEAAEGLKRAVAQATNLLGADDPVTLGLRNEFASLTSKLGDIPAAEPLYRGAEEHAVTRRARDHFAAGRGIGGARVILGRLRIGHAAVIGNFAPVAQADRRGRKSPLVMLSRRG
jgi:hypothetical protein